LREGVDRTAVDASAARNHAVARDDGFVHPEVQAAVRDEPVHLLKRARIEQQVDPLARRELAGFVLAAAAIVTAAQLRAPLEIFEMLGVIHAEESDPRSLSLL